MKLGYAAPRWLPHILHLLNMAAAAFCKNHETTDVSQTQTLSLTSRPLTDRRLGFPGWASGFCGGAGAA